MPVKDKSTVRLNVALGGGGVELLATGGRLRERAKSYAKALANDILR